MTNAKNLFNKANPKIQVKAHLTPNWISKNTKKCRSYILIQT